MLFDTHVHLSDPKFDTDRDQVIERSILSGVQMINEIADGPSEWEKARVLSEKYPSNIWWSAGIHPYFADQANDQVWAQLQALSSHPRFVAIGEVGLDYAKCPIPSNVQILVFETAIALSLKVKKPLIIHCREAYDDLMPILKKYGAQMKDVFGSDSPGVVHCFSGSSENAHELVQLGFYLGIDGPLTYPNAKVLRAAVEKVPLEKIVLETDAPYLPPQEYRGQRNEPSYLIQVSKKLAAIRGIDSDHVDKVVTKNGQTLFRLKPL